MKKTIVYGVLVCAAVSVLGDDEKKPVRTYTNEDLERVAPYRGETGALSLPGPQPRERSDAELPRKDPLHRGDEAYWRTQAQRLNDRLAELRRRADDLRGRIEDAKRRQAASRSAAKGSSRTSARETDATAALARRLRALEAEIAERQNAFDERAHRAGALPGWLR